MTRLSEGKEIYWPHSSYRHLAAFVATTLIALGVALEAMEVFLARVIGPSGWFFAMLLQGAWNIFAISSIAAPLREILRGSPLILAIAGAAIFLSRRPRAS